MLREFEAKLQKGESSFMAEGDGTHRLPAKSSTQKAIGKSTGDTVRVQIDERLS